MASGKVFTRLILRLRDGWVDNWPRGDLHARQRGEAREVKRALTGGNHCCFEFSEIVVFWVN